MYDLEDLQALYINYDEETGYFYLTGKDASGWVYVIEDWEAED